METVMAQGTFDVLHPGHVRYLEESAELGDKLVVVIARDSRANRELAFGEDERREIVEALEAVDRAILGREDDIYKTVEEVDPDTITLGYDQGHDSEEVKELAENATGHEVEVVRIKGYGEYSSSDIKADFRKV
jgi:FAD synthetase